MLLATEDSASQEASVQHVAQPHCLGQRRGTGKAAEMKIPNALDVNPPATAGGFDKNKTQVARATCEAEHA